MCTGGKKKQKQILRLAIKTHNLLEKCCIILPENVIFWIFVHIKPNGILFQCIKRVFSTSTSQKYRLFFEACIFLWMIRFLLPLQLIINRGHVSQPAGKSTNADTDPKTP